MALVGMPQVLPDQIYIEQDATEQVNELRVIRTLFDSSVVSNIEVGDTIVRIGDESVRDPAHLQELLQHFSGRTVFIQTTGLNDSQDDGKLTRATINTSQQQLDTSLARTHTYLLTSPLVGVVSAIQLASITPTVFTDSLFSGQSDVLDNIRVYGYVSPQYVGVIAVLAIVLFTAVYTLPRYVYHRLLSYTRSRSQQHYRGE